VTRKLAALAVALAFAFLLPANAHARAGGAHGGSHSSGSSHSGTTTSGGSSGGGGTSHTGSYSGSGSGQAGPITTAVIVTLLLLFGAYWAYNKLRGAAAGIETAANDYVPSAPAAGVDDDRLVRGLTAIKAHDPAFDQQAFLERARRTFTLAQQAWSDRNLAAVRPFMGQGTYLSWESQIGQMAKRHQKDVVTNVVVKGSEIVRAVRGPYEHLTVRFDASCVDYTIDDRTGAVVSGTKKGDAFTEYWTFERSGTTTTLQKDGVLEQKCPNCGAPLNVNAIGECTYCKAAVTNGTYDWVLQRIDQPDYWTGS
jgi:hypothetical protein